MQELNTNSKNPKDIDYLLLIAGILITGILLLIGIGKNCVNVYADDINSDLYKIVIDDKEYIVGCSGTYNNGTTFDYASLDYPYTEDSIKKNLDDFRMTTDNLQVFTCTFNFTFNDGTVSGFRSVYCQGGKAMSLAYNNVFDEFDNVVNGSTAMYLINVSINDNKKYSYHYIENTIQSKFIEIVKGNIPDGVTENKAELKPVYDLEIPLNFRINGKYEYDLGIVQIGNHKHKLTWEQTEGIDNKGWKTEIYIQLNLSYRMHFYDLKKKKITLDWFLLAEPYNYKYQYTYNPFSDKRIKELNNKLKDELGDIPFSTNFDSGKYMIRNKWINPDTGQVHYSNYIYSDGNLVDGYKAVEVDGESFDKKGTFDNDTIENSRKLDSDYYNNDIITGNNPDSESTASALGILKLLTNELKEFPEFFANFFTFIPSSYVAALSALLTLAIAIAFIRAIL